MDSGYLILPFVTWLLTGILKFLINSLKSGRVALDQVGYGGMPSNHSAIVTSMVVFIALREGLSHPALGVAVTIAFIVMLDANSLRGHISNHAKVINTLNVDREKYKLRERIGHTKAEIIAGALFGSCVAWLFNML